MKAAYLVGAVGTGCALALLYLKSWRKDEQTADHDAVGHPEEADEANKNKNGTTDNGDKKVKEYESHSVETCLETVNKFEKCGSKSHESIAQKKEGCEKSACTGGSDLDTVSEEFSITQSVEWEEMECKANAYVSCQPVLPENLNCVLDREGSILDGYKKQFCKPLDTPPEQDDPNCNTKNQNSNVSVNESAKESSETNLDITIGSDNYCTQAEEEVETRVECMKTYGNELLNSTVEEASYICSQDNSGSDCGTFISQQEHNTTEHLDVEECVAVTRDPSHSAAIEMLTKTKEDKVQQLSTAEILTQSKEELVEQLSVTEKLTHVEEDPVEQLSVAAILAPADEVVVEPLSILNFVKHSQSEEKDSICEDFLGENMAVKHSESEKKDSICEDFSGENVAVKHSESEKKDSICEDVLGENVALKHFESEKKESIYEDILGENVGDHSQRGDIGKQCKDNMNVSLAKVETEQLQTTEFVEPKREEDIVEQSVHGCLELRQDFGEDAEICPKTGENIEKGLDEVQNFCEGIKDRNCEQILGDDINCNVIVRNTIGGMETSTAVGNQAGVHRNTEDCEASTSDLSSSSEISEIDKVQEEPTTTEMLEVDGTLQNCTTTDLEQVFSKQVSDSASIASTDSGQGSCEIEPETFFASTSYPLPPQEYIFYEFVIPQALVGRLIGKKGAMVNKIRAQTDAHLIILPHNVNMKFKICSVEGTKEQVDAALDMIRKHFPLTRYPDVTLERVNQQPCTHSLEACFNAATLQLELPAGVVSEVQVCSIMSPCQFFVHLPLHPSHGNLARLLHCMNTNYTDGSTTPALPQPISAGTVCAALVNGQWQRCMVVSCEENCCSVNLLDLGGFVNIPIENLRQIRSDYLTLPFQAAQCLLNGVNSTTESWSDTTYAAFEELVSDSILFATVVAYTQEGIPFVNLYRRENDEYVSINEKLVQLGHAKWVAPVGMVA